MKEDDRSVDRAANLPRAFRRGLMLRARWRYLVWRIAHPRGGYGMFYSETIHDRLTRDVPHRTLGTQSWTNAKEAWASLEFAKRGTEILQDLAAFGLTRNSVCVDYGCGSLRIGQHLIRSLAPEKYWGLDVTNTFFRQALDALAPNLVATQKPRLAVIDDDVLDVLERHPPDFVFSYAVLKHVPPRELDRFFDRFMRLIGPRTIAVLYFPDAPATGRIGPMSWLHPAERLIGMVLRRQGTASVGITRIGPNAVGGRRHPRSVLWITGSEVDRPMPARLLVPEPADIQPRRAFMKASNASL